MHLAELSIGRPAGEDTSRPRRGVARNDNPDGGLPSRAPATPVGGASLEDLELYAKRARRTLADPTKAEWHNFGMEWKEHVAWIAPILATAVAFVVLYYGVRLAREQGMRRVLMALFVLAFAAAAVAGLFGAFINKVAPIT